MAEVAQLRQGGTLADRINAEHQACLGAVESARAHAIEAGRLLVQAKAGGSHGTWLPWLADNFEGSERTARGYMRLYRNWAAVEEAKRQSVADLGIGGALKAPAAPKPAAPAPLRGPDPFANVPEDAQPDPDAEQGLEDEQNFYDAWQRHDREALADLQAAGRAEDLRGIVKALDSLVHSYRPDQAGEALARATGKGRALVALHDSIAWLQQVLAEAEQAQGR